MTVDTGSSALSKNDIDRIVQALERRGGAITIQDPRVNSFKSWASVIIGGLLTTAIIWGVSSIVELNKQVAILISRPEPATKEQIDWVNRRLDALESRK